MDAHQGLTLGTSPEVGRFAKVLEEIDYQADVWAQLHERRLTADIGPESIKDDPLFARLLMRIAVETMLSFDDGPMASRTMRIRRVSRYLIWSWQYLRTERFDPGENIGTVLADKPFIELAGPEIRAATIASGTCSSRGTRTCRRSPSTTGIVCTASVQVRPHPCRGSRSVADSGW